jgi:hypothetical protein
MSTSYLDAIQDHWDSIVSLYRQFEDKKPVMVFDLHEQTVYAFPYEEFKTELNQKSRLALEEQYTRALSGNYLVVFIRDTEAGQMVSYSIGLEEKDD